mmetsp:Transcript_45342/g.129429  ORF Transcript_45342/g.129429 Transcript_45342/m.129429 type:complete len:225 (+) Transcript_45342:484-1158(+)
MARSPSNMCRSACATIFDATPKSGQPTVCSMPSCDRRATPFLSATLTDTKTSWPSFGLQSDVPCDTTVFTARPSRKRSILDAQLNSSTSKISVVSGGTSGGEPRSSYAYRGATTNLDISCCLMDCTASSMPSTTWRGLSSTTNLKGAAGSRHDPISVPSWSLATNFTATSSPLRGRASPFPAWMTVFLTPQGRQGPSSSCSESSSSSRAMRPCGGERTAEGRQK